MKKDKALKNTRVALVVTATLSFAAVAFWMLTYLGESFPNVIFASAIYVSPLLLGYILTRIKWVGRSSIGYSLPIILLYWFTLFFYSEWRHESGDGIALVFTFAFAIIYGLPAAALILAIGKKASAKKKWEKEKRG